VKEATAVAKLQELNQSNKDQSNKENQDLIQENDDDDIESVSSSSCAGSGSGSGKRNVGKQNQLARLKDGMRLRHLIPLNSSSGSGSNNDEWFAMFDAESNRIIRTPDGVAFDTLRQFARLHCNEVWGTTTVLTNVWSDPYFQYQDIDDDAWHPLSNLKK